MAPSFNQGQGSCLGSMSITSIPCDHYHKIRGEHPSSNKVKTPHSESAAVQAQGEGKPPNRQIGQRHREGRAEFSPEISFDRVTTDRVSDKRGFPSEVPDPNFT